MQNSESGNQRSGDEELPPVLFADVDGVLNRCAASGWGLEEEKLELLSQIVKATGCLLVLSSSWREYPDTKLPQLRRALASRGMVLFDKTPILVTSQEGCRIARARPRFEEIQAWLEGQPRGCQFLILDDESDFGPLREHHVKTESDRGLTRHHVEFIIGYFNGN